MTLWPTRHSQCRSGQKEPLSKALLLPVQKATQHPPNTYIQSTFYIRYDKLNRALSWAMDLSAQSLVPPKAWHSVFLDSSTFQETSRRWMPKVLNLTTWNRLTHQISTDKIVAPATQSLTHHCETKNAPTMEHEWAAAQVWKFRAGIHGCLTSWSSDSIFEFILREEAGWQGAEWSTLALPMQTTQWGAGPVSTGIQIRHKWRLWPLNRRQHAGRDTVFSKIFTTITNKKERPKAQNDSMQAFGRLRAA